MLNIYNTVLYLEKGSLIFVTFAWQGMSAPPAGEIIMFSGRYTELC